MRHGVITALMVIAIAGARGQERLNLAAAVDLALEWNHSLRAAGHGLDAAAWGERNAISAFLPKVEISSRVTRIDSETEHRSNASLEFIKAVAPQFGIPQSALSDIRPFTYRDTYVSGLSIVQPIYNGGAELVGVQAASAMHDRATHEYEETEQDVIARTKSAYLEVLKAEELVVLARESAERTRRWLDLTRRQEQLGSRTNTDVLRWEVQLAAEEGNIINAENGLALARLQLNDVIGVDLEAHYMLDSIGPEVDGIALRSGSSTRAMFALQQDGAHRSLLDGSFLASHPTMKKMEANLRLANANVSGAWTGFKPRINLAFQYGWEQNNTLKLDGIRPWALSLNVSFPIFNGFGDYTRLEQSKADLRQATEHTESYRRLLLLQARNAELAVASARKRIEIGQVGLKQAEDVLASVARRYDLGAATNVDLIDTQTAYTAARTSLITAIYDHHIATVQLARATGTISR